MISGIMKTFKMTCEDVYPLISESRDRSLPFFKRMRLKMHLALCGLCNIYQNQLDILSKIAQLLGENETKALEENSMRPETKEKIQKWIINKT